MYIKKSNKIFLTAINSYLLKFYLKYSTYSIIFKSKSLIEGACIFLKHKHEQTKILIKNSFFPIKENIELAYIN